MKNRKAIAAWCLYDWANSAFPTIITTFVFATYFTSAVAVNKTIGTAQWGNAMAIAGLLVALFSPPIGAIADYVGRRKPWLALFTLISIAASSMLWFSEPQSSYVAQTLIWVVIATLGFEFSMVFYNAMLNDLAPKSHLGRLSGWGWGVGYIGGLACLMLALFLFIKTDTPLFNLSKQNAEHIRICGPLVGAWFALFAWPLFVWVKDRDATGLKIKTAVAKGINDLIKTLKQLPQRKNLFCFLIARMIYIDGLNTLFIFGGIYAAGTFGMNVGEVMQFAILMNISAGLGAIALAWVDDWLGAKPTLLMSLSGLTLTLIALLIIDSKLVFILMAVVLGLFVGPIQAASRSLMTRISPEEHMTEMFGLYAFSGKATAFIGPWLVGVVTLLTNNQRLGMATLLPFFVVGGVLLIFVSE